MRRPLVWVIEDNDVNFELMEFLLEDAGCRIERARDFVELRRLLQREPPSLVLLDVNLPGLSGLEIVRHLRGEAGMAATPILAVTAHAMAGDRERFLAAGFTEYLAKPLSPSTLRSVLRNYLGPSESSR